MRGWLVFAVVNALLPAAAVAQESAPGEPESESATEAYPAPDAEAAESAEEPGDWWVEMFGYVRVAYENVQEDPDFEFVGRNNGFVLHNARLGVEGGTRDGFASVRVSVDGAADIRDTVNDPQGELDVRLRDAFFRIDPTRWVGLQVGQFKAPFSAEELRSTADLRFASRAVGLEGVAVGRGREEPGIFVGRELGVMLSAAEPIDIAAGLFVNYYLAATNGARDNRVLNDNNELAYFGRLELGWATARPRDSEGTYEDLAAVRAGFSILSNSRTVGALPNLFDEDDFGWSADLLIGVLGLEVFGQYTEVTTEFPTTGTPDQVRNAAHVQVSYRFDLPYLDLAPAYRLATYDPRAEGGEDAGGVDLASFGLTYHTIGLALWADDYPVSLFVNYTITGEEAPRELENDRLEVLTQLVF